MECLEFSEKTKNLIQYLKNANSDFGFRVDRKGLESFNEKFQIFYQNKLDNFRSSIIKDIPDLVDYNINSRVHLKRLLDFYGIKPISTKPWIEEETSTSQKVWVPYVDKFPGKYLFLEELLKIKDIEILRRRLTGSKSKKEDSSIFSYLTDEEYPLLITDFTYGHRCVHQIIYSLPYEIREYLLPINPDNQLVYFDLSSAELGFLAQIIKCDNLNRDILSGNFWYDWLEKLNVDPSKKDDLKSSVYSIIYSAGPNSTSPSIPSSLFPLFLREYPELRQYLSQKKIQFNQGIRSGHLWERSYYDVSDHNNPFPAFLSRPIQVGLTILSMAITKKLRDKGLSVRTWNVDSCTIEVPKGEFQYLNEEIQDCYSMLGFEFNFKLQSGNTYAQAQLGKVPDLVKEVM